MVSVRKITKNRFLITTDYSQEYVSASELKWVRELKGKISKVKKLKNDETATFS